MATTSQGLGSRIPALSRRTIIIISVAVVALVAAIVIPALRSNSNATTIGQTYTVATADIRSTITATGKMSPLQSANLSFATGGKITDVMVNTGDSVTAQAPLVTLDSAMLQLDATAAQAALDQAKADAVVAQAQVTAAEAALKQTLGSVTANDVTAARATLTEAQARLALLSSGTRAEVVARAQAAVAQSEADLASQRKNLAVAKEQADITVTQRANAVREAQTAFAAAREDWEHVQKDDTDPRTGRGLSDPARRDYQNAFESAQLSLTNAENNLTQATRDAEVARQNEISGIASAEARLATARADFDALTGGATVDVASAQADVAQAEANLNKLLGDQRSAQVEAQEANVVAAKAGLDRANARVAQAQAQYEMATLRVDDATLKAPFAGVVANVDAKPGEFVTNAPVVSILDITKFEVLVTVDEVDVAKVSVGQPVEVFVDALGAPVLPGTVVSISPEAQSDRGVVSYEITVEVTPDDRAVKAGMTASAQIITASANDVVSVPRSAVRTVDGQTVVTVITNNTREDRPVTVGVRDSDLIEITSGLSVGDVVEVTQ